MKIGPLFRALGLAYLAMSSTEAKTNLRGGTRERATIPTPTNNKVDTMMLSTMMLTNLQLQSSLENTWSPTITMMPRNLQLSLENPSSPTLTTGAYVETDHTGSRFTNRGVNLVDNVFMGFSKVSANGQVDLPADFQTKKAAASPDARQSVSLGGATYTDEFRTCLASGTSLNNLIQNTISLAQIQKVAIDFDFEFPNSASEATAYAQLINEVTTALNQPVFIALPYMSQMHWMMNSPEIKSVLKNPLVHTEVFGYDMTRAADPDGAWKSYDKGSCVRDDLNDTAQVQWIRTSANTEMQTRLSIESYLNLLTDTFGLSEDAMGRVHVGLPGYTALQREDWAHVSSVGAPDSNCLVHEVTVSKNGVSYTDYAMTASDIADATRLFRNGSMGHNLGGVFIYEAGHLVGPEFIQGMVTAAGNGTDADLTWEQPAVTAATQELCIKSIYNCVASRVRYGYSYDAAIKEETIDTTSGVSFIQTDIEWYASEFAKAATPNGEKTGFKTVELQAISSDEKHVASITIDDKDMQRRALDRVKALFQGVVPGGHIDEVHDTETAPSESPTTKDNTLVLGLAIALGIGIPTLLVCLLLSRYMKSEEHAHTDDPTTSI